MAVVQNGALRYAKLQSD